MIFCWRNVVINT